MSYPQNRYYSNTAAITSLATTGGISSTATSFSTASQNGWPTLQPFVARLEPNTINEELVLVTGGVGTSSSPYTCTRGYDGTTAVAHAQGITVSHGICQLDVQDPQVHLNLRSGGVFDQYGFTAHNLPATAWNGSALSPVSSQTISSNQTSITLAMPSSTFNTARIFIRCKTSDSGSSQNTTFNMTVTGGISGSYQHGYYGVNQSGAVSGFGSALTASRVGWAANNNIASAMGYTWIDIPFFADTLHHHTWNSFSAISLNEGFATPSTGPLAITLFGGNTSSSAITSVTLTPDSSASWLAPGVFEVYGLL